MEQTTQKQERETYEFTTPSGHTLKAYTYMLGREKRYIGEPINKEARLNVDMIGDDSTQELALSGPILQEWLDRMVEKLVVEITMKGATSPSTQPPLDVVLDEMEAQDSDAVFTEMQRLWMEKTKGAQKKS